MALYGGAFDMRVWRMDEGWACLQGDKR